MSKIDTALPHVRAIPPYPPGRPIDDVAREFGLDPATIVKIASNENPLGCSPKVTHALTALASGVNLYPDFDCYELTHALAAANGVEPAQVLPAAGSSEIIQLVARAFLEPGRAAIIPQYSFQAYVGAAMSVGAQALFVPAQDFAVDLDALLDAVTERTTVLFLASPNNPTGTLIAPDALDRFVDALPEHVLLVIDDAYCEYVEPALRFDSVAALQRRRNLLVMRTFSKIHGLAGLRIGYALGDPELLGLLRRLQVPFSVSATAQVAAVAALADTAFAERSRTENAKERARLALELSRRDIAFLPSAGNFLLLHVGAGAELADRLMRQGVIVRPVDGYGLQEWLRVSIGLPEETDRFLAALDAVHAEAGQKV